MSSPDVKVRVGRAGVHLKLDQRIIMYLLFRPLRFLNLAPE